MRIRIAGPDSSPDADTSGHPQDTPAADRPVTVSLEGRFDAHETAGFRAVVEPLLAGSEPVLQVDLANVIFVDSSALAELLRTQKQARERGGDLVLTALSDPVRVILELTALLPVFTVDLGRSTGTAG